MVSTSPSLSICTPEPSRTGPSVRADSAPSTATARTPTTEACAALRARAWAAIVIGSARSRDTASSGAATAQAAQRPAASRQAASSCGRCRGRTGFIAGSGRRDGTSMSQSGVPAKGPVFAFVKSCG